MPQNMEMLNTLVMYLGGVEAAPVLGWWIRLFAFNRDYRFVKSILGKESSLGGGGRSHGGLRVDNINLEWIC